MSYLSFPRLNFFGLFQADPSTVNNDPRHYDTAGFRSSDQDLSAEGQFNGWWNPDGTSVFRLVDCKVTSAALGPDKVLTAESGGDAVLGARIGNTTDTTSAKIVDLDPDWQLASQIFGLNVRLVDGAGAPLLSGSYGVRADPDNPFGEVTFRDLWFSRVSAGGDSGASAMWQSVLTHLAWGEGTKDSPVLTALREAAGDGPLSMRLSTFYYVQDSGDPQFTYGTVIGTIGVARAGEPVSFVAGRRFMPMGGTVASPANIGIFSAEPDPNTETLNLDLSNAFPLESVKAPNPKAKAPDIGPLKVAVLKRPDAGWFHTVEDDDIDILGEIDYATTEPGTDTSALFSVHGGIATVPAARERIAGKPLALLSRVPDGHGADSGKHYIQMREAQEGLEIRSETVDLRLESDVGDTGSCAGSDGGTIAPITAANVRFVARRYGEPLAGARVAFWPDPPSPDTGDTPVNKPAVWTTPPQPTPINNVPPGVFAIEPAGGASDFVTGDDGILDVTVRVTRPLGYPRAYMDGQLYTVSYNFAELPGDLADRVPAARQQQFDKLAVMVFSAFEAQDDPEWETIAPILRMYANLYPVMSKGLFDFANRQRFEDTAALMRFAFGKTNPNDPDYMPVTRDLSANKRRTILAYLDNILARGPSATMGTSEVGARSRLPTRRAADRRPASAGAPRAGPHGRRGQHD